jgi:hypothetical protein
MMFLFKPKVINLDCYTWRSEVYEYNPIDYSSKFVPTWWKNLPNISDIDIIDTHNNMKKCIGFTNIFKHGITIPLWTDMLVTINPEIHGYEWVFADGVTLSNVHGVNQYDGFINTSEYGHLKIHSPWTFTCKEDVDFLMYQNTWCHENKEDYFIPPGIIDFKYQNSTNINLFFNLRRNKRFLVEAEQPLVNIVPIDSRKVKIHNHLVSKEEYDKIHNLSSRVTFRNKYLRTKSFILRKERNGCPF